MIERHCYIGKLNGISGVWCDQKPEGIELEKENTFYTPDEGMVFTKDGKLFDTAFIRDESVKIEDYVEIKDPRIKPEEQEEALKEE